MYEPNPIDTKDVVLSEDIMELAEIISKQVHEIWSKGRIEDGWTYGPERNDALKQTPCLVPYDELSENEKDVDRRTAFETLKLMVKLGYSITK